jgi:hypothetical protein
MSPDPMVSDRMVPSPIPVGPNPTSPDPMVPGRMVPSPTSGVG